ncbi:hypothetical protein D3C85_884230 [compost metagenome]
MQTGHLRDRCQYIVVEANPDLPLVSKQIRRIFGGSHHHLRMPSHPGSLLGRQHHPLLANVRPQAGGPASENFPAQWLIDAGQGVVDHAPQQRVAGPCREREADRWQGAGADDLQAYERPQGHIGANDDFITDEGIHLPLVERLQTAQEIGREDDLAVRVDLVDDICIGVTIEQDNFLSRQIHPRQVIASPHQDHRTVRHIIGRKCQPRHAALEAVGTGQHIDVAVVQGFDGFVAFGIAKHARRHAQAPGDQAEVIGTDTLIAVAVDGDVYRLIVGNGDAHPQFRVALKPLLFVGVQVQRGEIGERLDQRKRQALRCLRHRAEANQPQAHDKPPPWQCPNVPHNPLLFQRLAQPLIM